MGAGMILYRYPSSSLQRNGVLSHSKDFNLWSLPLTSDLLLPLIGKICSGPSLFLFYKLLVADSHVMSFWVASSATLVRHCPACQVFSSVLPGFPEQKVCAPPETASFAHQSHPQPYGDSLKGAVNLQGDSFEVCLDCPTLQMERNRVTN